MRYFSLLLLSIFLISCGPKGIASFNNKAVQLPNGCLISAEVYQAHLILDDSTVWNRILIVYYNDHGTPYSHAWCVFMPKLGGELWAYDYKGSTHLKGDSLTSPEDIASQLEPFPTWGARFIDN